MTMNSLPADADAPCRAKDPESWRFHSAEAMLNAAVAQGNPDFYLRARAVNLADG